MGTTFLFRIVYRSGVTPHAITSTVESVEGVRIQRLTLVSKGKNFVGTIAIEVSRLMDFAQVMSRIRKSRGISKVEQLNGSYCCG
jgi:hypothetical protein